MFVEKNRCQFGQRQRKTFAEKGGTAKNQSGYADGREGKQIGGSLRTVSGISQIQQKWS